MVQHLITEPHAATKKQELIRCRDRLFGSLLRTVTYNNEKTKVTKAFNEFMKGITYFKNKHLMIKINLFIIDLVLVVKNELQTMIATLQVTLTQLDTLRKIIFGFAISND